MAGGVQEGHLPVVDPDHVGSDGLGDAAGFLVRDIGLSHGVQKGSLTVIHMTHDADHRGTLRQKALVLLVLLQKLRDDIHRDFLLAHDLVIDGDILRLLEGQLRVHSGDLALQKQLLDNDRGN